MRQDNAFVAVLRSCGIEMHFLPPSDGATLDALYVRDVAVVAHDGAILCNMGKAERRGEPDAVGAFLERLDVPLPLWRA